MCDDAAQLGPSTDGDREPDTQHVIKPNAYEVPDGLAYKNSDVDSESVAKSHTNSNNRPHAHGHADAFTVACYDTWSTTMFLGAAGLF